MVSCVRMLIVSIWLFILILERECAIQCKDDNNNAVDWFVVSKLPILKSSRNKLVQEGRGYMYITSDNVSEGWRMSEKSIDQNDSLIGYSLLPLYQSESNNGTVWLLYNNETPNKRYSSKLGHTKGVVLADKEQGIWIVHSVPRFPPVPPETYHYPKSGLKYGQSFLCISLAQHQINTVGEQLIYNEPQVFSANIPESVRGIYPNLLKVVDKSWVSSSPWNHQQQLQSLKGTSFLSFAKSGHFDKELYMDWVAPSLAVNMMVETWPNGAGRLPSECKYPFRVYNVKSIFWHDMDFLSHVDHSKWGVSSNDTLPWVCIGDINRMASQELRGGGTVCTKHNELWYAYKQIIKKVESC